MKHRRLAAWLLLLCLSSGMKTGGQALEHEAKSLRLPGHKAFPVPEADLLKVRDEQNLSAMQDHAWGLFAGLTDSKEPVWETWYTKCDVKLFSGDACKSDSGAKNDRFLQFEIPVQSLFAFEQSETLTQNKTHLVSPAAAPAISETNGLQNTFGDIGQAAHFFEEFKKHPQLAAVLFNKAAAEHILKNNLYDSQVLQKMLNDRQTLVSTDSEREIPPFPNDSVVLKTAWQLVKLDDDHPEDHRTEPLYIWNPRKQLEPGASLGNVSGWENSVIIDTSSQHCEDRDYTTADGTVPVVPLGCFYYMELKDPKDFPHGLANMVGPYGEPRRTPVYLILVAVHVITKETPDWVWATFWWHNQSSLNKRPGTIKGNKWRHFLMNTTLSPKTPLDASGGPRICFNPFLEEKFTNGTRSNCMVCHSKAIFGRSPSVGAEPAPAGYFDNALRTDFMWTIANVRNADIMNFLKSLQTVSTPP